MLEIGRRDIKLDEEMKKDEKERRIAGWKNKREADMEYGRGRIGLGVRGEGFESCDIELRQCLNKL